MSDKNELYDLYDNEPLPEGVEAPPPHTHTMSIVRWMILGALTIFALVMLLSYFGVALRADEAKAVQYHCPMHPTYVSNQPGECPICGMSLVPTTEKSGETKKPDSTVSKQKETAPVKAKVGQYTCPMHPEVISDKPGKCPKCGMNLEPVKEKVTYTCPMHPEVISDKPGKCPKCGMNLIEEKEKVQDDSLKKMKSTETPSETGHGENATAEMGNMAGMEGTTMPTAEEPVMSDMGSSPVPGLVPVTIEPQRLQLIGVRIAKVENRIFGEGLRLVGYVTPDEARVANVHVRTSGWVTGLFVDQTGQFVKKNEILLALYSQDLYQAEEDFILARNSAGRTSSDSTMTYTRQELLTSARERLRLLGLSEEEILLLEKADAPDSQMALRSPFSGYVLEKAVNSGQYVTPDQNLFTLADLSTLWVIAEVYEQDIADIHIGQSAKLHFTSLPGEELRGKVGFIYPSVSEKTRTLKVRVELSNPALRLRPGMYADVELSSKGESILAVPSEAVINTGETQYAFVVHDGTHFEPRLLKVGRMSDDWQEVITGLSEGEQVVTDANFLIDSESRLKAAISGLGGAQAESHSGHQH